MLCSFSQYKLEDVAYELLNQDYKFLNENNMLEEEDGEGATYQSRNLNKINGPQRGYGSGRSQTILVNNHI